MNYKDNNNNMENNLKYNKFNKHLKDNNNNHNIKIFNMIKHQLVNMNKHLKCYKMILKEEMNHLKKNQNNLIKLLILIFVNQNMKKVQQYKIPSLNHNLIDFLINNKNYLLLNNIKMKNLKNIIVMMNNLLQIIVLLLKQEIMKQMKQLNYIKLKWNKPYKKYQIINQKVCIYLNYQQI